MHTLRCIVTACVNLVLPPTARQQRLETLTARELAPHITQPTSSAVPNALILAPYGAPLVRDAVCTLKYDGAFHIADAFAEVLHPHLIAYLAEYAHMSALTEPLLVPVPLSAIRYRQRGYNQADHIARALARIDADYTWTYAPAALRRIRDTKPQTNTESDTVRTQNLAGAFRADAEAVRGRTVILLDDVITSGATMRAAASALTDAGARDVIPVAVAGRR